MRSTRYLRINGVTKMKIKSEVIGMQASFFVSAVLAMLMVANAGGWILDVPKSERAAVVCDAWGRCWVTNYDPRRYRHDQEHAWRHWEHDEEHALRHWEHDRERAWRHSRDEWDGRDWHGGRWGEW